jgi:hypothetical protein
MAGLEAANSAADKKINFFSLKKVVMAVPFLGRKLPGNKAGYCSGGDFASLNNQGQLARMG